MAFKLLNEEEPLKVDSIMTVLYGEPGIGKTSLAFTANKPLLEDYDDGLKRAVGRKTALKIDSWKDAIEFHKSEEFKTFNPKTIIIDTAGSMLDNFITQYCIGEDHKNSRSGGELSLQGYGALKSVFKQFVNEMKAKNVDIVFLAHSSLTKDGDQQKYRPKMTGGSYDILVAVADIIGYMESVNNKRTIDFYPTDRHIGKNTAEFEKMNIPHYTEKGYQNFLGAIIDKTKTKMQTMSEAQKEAMNKMTVLRKEVEDTDDRDAILVLRQKAKELSEVFRIQVQSLADKKYIALWEQEILVVSRPEEANEYLKLIGETWSMFQETLKRFLWEHTTKGGMYFDKDNGAFAMTEVVVEEPTEKTTV